jgi:ribonucleoside-triphosphate reductase
MARTENKITGENAADRLTYVGEIFSIGEKQRKEAVLNQLPAEWSMLHRDGYIHIHDLDAYGFTYNCLAVDLRRFFPYERMVGLPMEVKIICVFDFIKEFLTKLGNEQSGGMAFANFDIEIAEILEKLEIILEESNIAVLQGALHSFIVWCNNSHERMGKVSYYVSLNIGLANTACAKKICYLILDVFENTSPRIYKPNIIFKVKSGVNLNKIDWGNDLFQKSLRVTTRKMIPTYVLCDAKPNKEIDPMCLAIMGCRTKVVADKYGNIGSIGRGNIGNISINLPRIAMEIVDKKCDKVVAFLSSWNKVATIVSDILENRYDRLVTTRQVSDFRTNVEYELWCTNFKGHTLGEIFKHGTLSIGFIGLYETVKILTGKGYYEDENANRIAIEIVQHMRHFIDRLNDTTEFNWSLLATSGELISGKFTTIDKNKGFHHKTMKKGFYTNSFHVDVSSGISSFQKILVEAPFHELCNGGCITYVELKDAPLGNELSIEEMIIYAITQGIHYLGFNYSLDICNDCETKGVFEICPGCGSSSITRVRRVSGYLEELDYFTVGKKQEVKFRKQNN